MSPLEYCAPAIVFTSVSADEDEETQSVPVQYVY